MIIFQPGLIKFLCINTLVYMYRRYLSFIQTNDDRGTPIILFFYIGVNIYIYICIEGILKVITLSFLQTNYDSSQPLGIILIEQK